MYKTESECNVRDGGIAQLLALITKEEKQLSFIRKLRHQNKSFTKEKAQLLQKTNYRY